MDSQKIRQIARQTAENLVTIHDHPYADRRLVSVAGIQTQVFASLGDRASQYRDKVIKLMMVAIHQAILEGVRVNDSAPEGGCSDERLDEIRNHFLIQQQWQEQFNRSIPGDVGLVLALFEDALCFEKDLLARIDFLESALRDCFEDGSMEVWQAGRRQGREEMKQLMENIDEENGR